MADRWQLCTDDEAERRAFASLAATLALPGVPAGPRNRLRHVLRLEVGGRTYYLKTFARTQWQNRLVFATTAPRAADDAEREHLVTQALRAAGHAAPRPVATGRRGRASFYLCAQLPGESLRTRLQRGVEPELLRTVAVWCGRLLGAGFWLPDLSADHVFVHDQGHARSFGVLDLHNGRLGRPGPVPRQVLVRTLRHFARSVRDLLLPSALALRFAVRLLRAAGSDAAQRLALLRRLPPWATARRYDAPGKSDAYAERNPARSARELALLAEVWPGRAGETVLDLPCGAGRLLPFLQQRGHRVVRADGSLPMLHEARRRDASPPAVLGDALAMPFRPAAVDGIVMFRFLHHLAPDAARLAIAESCRVAGRFVVVSFFHPCSFHHLQRSLGTWLGRPPTRFARSLAAMQRLFAAHGFELAAHTADLPFARDLWLAAFVRTLAKARPSP